MLMMPHYEGTNLPKRNLNFAAPPFHQPPTHYQHHIPVPGYYYTPYPAPNNPVAPTFVHYPAFQPQPQYDPNTYFVNFSTGMPNMQELGSGHWDYAWQGIGVGSRSFLRPQFYNYYDPTPTAPGIMVDQSLIPIKTLRNNIIKQIEYYFSDENLKKDHYLISLMDDKGWVPISTVADFKRVKSMCRDIPFILDSLLLGSTSVQVQGNVIRRRDQWSKWIPAGANPMPTYTALAA